MCMFVCTASVREGTETGSVVDCRRTDREIIREIDRNLNTDYRDSKNRQGEIYKARGNHS